MHGVGLDGRGEVLPYRPRRSRGGISGAHEVPEARDGVLPCQRDGHARPLGHEGAEARVEGALLVHDVEASRLGGSEMDEAGGEDLETALLEAGNDLPHRVLGYRIGLDDGQRALDKHEGFFVLSESYFLPTTRATVMPMSAGLFTVVISAGSLDPHFFRPGPLLSA